MSGTMGNVTLEAKEREEDPRREKQLLKWAWVCTTEDRKRII